MSDISAMAGPVAAWHTEHVYFNQLLHLLQREVDVFQTGERPNYELMYDIVSYLREYSDAVHHPREDVAFARLAKRCPDMALALARLGQEHRVIAQAGETLVQQIEAILGGAIVQRAEVEMAAATYLVYYGSHIAKEEQDVLTRAAATSHAEGLGSGQGSGANRHGSPLRRRSSEALSGVAPAAGAGGLALREAAS